MDVSVCVYCKYGTSIENYWQEYLEKCGIKYFFACPGEKFRLYEGLKNIKNWLSDHPVDIVHSHNQIGTIMSAFIKPIHRYRILVRTAHIDSEFGTSFIGLLSRIIFIGVIYPLFVDKEVGVSLAITSELNQQIVRKVLQKKAFWIPNALPSENHPPGYDGEVANIIGVKSEDDWIITTIGLLVERKKIDVLIRAMANVVNIIPKARLVIVGGGPELDRLINLSIELGISKSCRFTGQQKNILPVLKNTNVFVLPSSSEGLSTVILEAMNNNVPVIASDIPGNRELIINGLTGWLVPVGDMDGLANTIVKAYQQPEKMKRMAQEAYTRTADYSITDVSNKYFNLYLSLMQNP
jgi:glycosyltransferase involved in cell wall biosynthesis